MITDIDEYVDCPMCHSTQAWEEAFMGLLGRSVKWRCRACGWIWSTDPLAGAYEEEGCNLQLTNERGEI